MGNFETNSIKGISIDVKKLLQINNLELVEFIEIVDYYAVLKVSGSVRGNIVDVCVEEHLEDYTFQDDLKLEFK